MAKLPGFMFYPGDWLKDPALRCCSHAAKGVWIDILCLMFESEQRGLLVSGGNVWSDEEIARAVGGDYQVALAGVCELVAKGVVSRNQFGCMYSRRLVRDEELRRIRSEAGSQGGRPTSEKKSKPKAKTKQNTESESENETPSTKTSAQILQVFDHYRMFHLNSFRKPKKESKEWRLIQARLSEGYSVEDLKAAIDGCHRSPFHAGENERGKRYDHLELIMRDGSHVQQFMEIPEPGDEPVMSERNRRNMNGARDYLDSRM